MTSAGALIAPKRFGAGFRWLLMSSWASNLGDGISVAAGPLLIASMTDNAVAVAMSVVLQRLPWLLFSLQIGVLADRLDRRRLVVMVNIGRAGIVAALAVLLATDTASVAIVLVAMFALGVGEMAVDISAATLLPMVVPPIDLGPANSRLQFGYITVNQLAGPALGAALFVWGRAVPFVLMAACMLLGGLCLLPLRLARGVEPSAVGAMWAEVVDGLRWLWRDGRMRVLTVTVLLFNVTFGAAMSVLVLLAAQRLGLDELGFGLLTAVGAFGGLAATVAYGRLETQVGPARLMRIGLMIETATHLTFASSRSPVLAMVVMCAFGAHEAVWFTTVITVRQKSVPLELQGRVGAIYSLGVFGGLVVGGLLGGVLADVWGITAPFWFAFVGSALILAWIWRRLDELTA